MKKTGLKDFGLLILRIGSGAMMLTHGIPKIERLLGDEPVKFLDLFGIGPEISLGLAVFAEVICSILVMIGFQTRIASIPLLITMLTAAFVAHADDPFATKEKPLLFFLIFLGILIMGAGRISLDNGFKKKKRNLF